MHWYCRVYTDEDEWTAYCIWAPTEYRALNLMSIYLRDVEGAKDGDIHDIEVEMWNTFEHGDINDYPIVN